MPVNDERARELCERLRTYHSCLPDEMLDAMRDSLAAIRAIRINPGHYDTLAEAVWNGVEPIRTQSADLIEAYAARLRVFEEALTHIASATRIGPITDRSAWQSLANACQKTARAAFRQETNHD